MIFWLDADNKPDQIPSFGTSLPLRNLKSWRLRSVFMLWPWQPTTLNMSALLLCIHENRCRFESKNGSHVALFSAPMCSCGQRRCVRHDANYVAYAQMPGCPLCSILPLSENEQEKQSHKPVTSWWISNIQDMRWELSGSDQCSRLYSLVSYDQTLPLSPGDTWTPAFIRQQIVSPMCEVHMFRLLCIHGHLLLICNADNFVLVLICTVVGQ